MKAQAKKKAKNKCFICDSGGIIDVHHVIPQATGGEAGPTVSLCPSCHSGIHRQAMNILSKTAKKISYFNEEQMVRAKPLVKILVAYIQRGKEDDSQRARSIVSVEVDVQFLKILHLLKVDAGFTNLEEYVLSLLMAEARRKI